MKNLIIQMTVLCITTTLIISITFGAIINDLSDYPFPFISNQLSDSIIIVGENAKIEDGICATNLVTSLGPGMTYEMIVLDTEVEDIKAQDVIIVGGPCVNVVAAEIMGWPLKCDQDFEPGKAKIKLFKGLEGQGDNVALLVAGYAAADTTIAGAVLSNYKDYDLKGNELEVAGTVLNDVVIEPVK